MPRVVFGLAIASVVPSLMTIGCHRELGVAAVVPAEDLSFSVATDLGAPDQFARPDRWSCLDCVAMDLAASPDSALVVATDLGAPDMPPDGGGRG